jgi:heme/copper-type cytochrome/quinol oxidase subunit 1
VSNRFSISAQKWEIFSQNVRTVTICGFMSLVLHHFVTNVNDTKTNVNDTKTNVNNTKTNVNNTKKTVFDTKTNVNHTKTNVNDTKTNKLQLRITGRYHMHTQSTYDWKCCTKRRVLVPDSPPQNGVSRRDLGHGQHV